MESKQPSPKNPPPRKNPNHNLLQYLDPSLLDEADQFSKRAIEAMPWASYTNGTRGSVLV
jgi:hypothetical protein